MSPHRTAGGDPDPAALLRDLKIIDLTSMIAGPMIGRMCAELGADVIHIEPPDGDDGRNSTTPFMGREGVFYSICNRSKRGIVVDLKQDAGKEIVQTLAQSADVFVENMTPGTLDALGLGYEALRALNPSLVYVSISGWGASGPLSRMPGYDILIQAYSGAMLRPMPELPPMLMGALIGDTSAPLLGAFGMMAMLRQREKTGLGGHVTTSLLQGALHVLSSSMLKAEADRTPPTAVPRGLPGGSGVFQCRDGRYVVIAAWTDKQFRSFAHLAGYSHLAEDPAYATRYDRQIAASPLNELFAEWTLGRPAAQVIAALRDEGIPCSPVHAGMDDLMTESHVMLNELIVSIDHPELGRLWQVGAGYEIDGHRGQIRYAPRIGEHTDEVLREHGYSNEDIERLRRSKVIA